MFKEIWKELIEEIKRGLRVAAQAFCRALWEEIEGHVLLSARKSLGIIKSYLESTDCTDKKEYIVNLIMTKIKLPLVFRPFKGLIKNMVREKLDEIIKKIFGLADEAVSGHFKIVG